MLCTLSSRPPTYLHAPQCPARACFLPACLARTTPQPPPPPPQVPSPPLPSHLPQVLVEQRPERGGAGVLLVGHQQVQAHLLAAPRTSTRTRTSTGHEGRRHTQAGGPSMGGRGGQPAGGTHSSPAVRGHCWLGAAGRDGKEATRPARQRPEQAEPAVARRTASSSTAAPGQAGPKASEETKPLLSSCMRGKAWQPSPAPLALRPSLADPTHTCACAPKHILCPRAYTRSHRHTAMRAQTRALRTHT